MISSYPLSFVSWLNNLPPFDHEKTDIFKVIPIIPYFVSALKRDYEIPNIPISVNRMCFNI